MPVNGQPFSSFLYAFIFNTTILGVWIIISFLQLKKYVQTD